MFYFYTPTPLPPRPPIGNMRRFTDVFRGYKKGPLGSNGLNRIDGNAFFGNSQQISQSTTLILLLALNRYLLMNKMKAFVTSVFRITSVFRTLSNI